MMRIGVASVMQETNTFSPRRSTLADFEPHGIFEGKEIPAALGGTNTEIAGAMARVAKAGADPVPLVRAWSMASGRLTSTTLQVLAEKLRRRIREERPLDGLVLSLHGAMAAANADDADLVLLRTARAEMGADAVIGVCLDLHANVTAALVAESDFVIGYHTYPHVDMANTGARAAGLVLDSLEGKRQPVTRLAKRAMLTPPEAQGERGPFGELRKAANECIVGRVLDISLFPSQPWLDVPELGFGVTVTTNADPGLAQSLAEEFAERAWETRAAFQVELVKPVDALEWVRSSGKRPVLLVESADSPTAGAAADSPAMVEALLEHGADLRAHVTLVDAPAVSTSFAAGEGTTVELTVGCSIESRFFRPVELSGLVRCLGDAPLTLAGPVFHGMRVTMGRYAVVDIGQLSILVTELPAYTFDPQTFRHAGLSPEDADVVVVRSAHLFRAGWSGIADEWRVLDLPGASTPRFDTLTYSRAPRPLYPLDVR